MKTALLAALAAALLSPAAAAKDEPAPPARAAGSVIRSKEWKIRRFPKREEEFIGEVRYQSGPTRLNSDWALFQQETGLWQARGSVAVTQTLASGEKVEARGEQASHDQGSQKGWLTAEKGRLLEFTRIPPSGTPEFGRAERLDWEGQKKVLGTGRVHAWGEQAESWAERAEWRDGLLELTGGRPVLHQKQGEDWTGAVKAERIRMSRADGALAADGRATGWILFKEDPLEKRP
jgi:hypothetical protein